MFHQDRANSPPVDGVKAKMWDDYYSTLGSVPVLVRTVRVNHCGTVTAQGTNFTWPHSANDFASIIAQARSELCV